MNQENTEQNTDKRKENLILWKPGESGNPLGRPKKEFSLTEGMREFLAETDPTQKKQRKDLLIEKTFQMAQRGDIAAIKLLWDKLEGEAPLIDARSYTQNLSLPTKEATKQELLNFLNGTDKSYLTEFGISEEEYNEAIGRRI